jgi:hypothetical protein
VLTFGNGRLQNKRNVSEIRVARYLFLDTIHIPKRGKIYQITTTLPNGHKIYITALSILRPSKIYPNWDFWFENKPSGNPV